MADVFVSYSQEDEAAARSLKTALAEQGNQVWLAGDELRSGERWADAIHERLRLGAPETSRPPELSASTTDCELAATAFTI